MPSCWSGRQRHRGWLPHEGPALKRLTATVRGHVQGVGFRWFVIRQAARLGLTGWVANEADGTVRVVAEGPQEALDELLNLLRGGPSGAHVTGVDREVSEASGSYVRFDVRAGGHSGD